MSNSNRIQSTWPFTIFMFLLVTNFFYSCRNVTQTHYQKGNESIEIASHNNVKRVGMVIKIKTDRVDEYLALHADSIEGVRDLLTKYNLRNFSIFLTQLEDGNFYEFGYYEYWGNDFEEDMQKLSEEPKNIEWLEQCDPMQLPLEGETSWKEMQRIYFNY